ncbi:hypothetical protein JXA88_00030 [Candidatus Fermentibacteria bacterium]|nr:hypothetical protein [Candidatus Fermentibacteria bacterium]
MDSVSLAAWRALYERAIRIKELAPWTWMREDEIFGVEDPDSKTVAYVSISGALGEHLAVIAYLGESALHRFLWLQTREGDTSPQDILEMRQIQASFEGRNFLETPELGIIRELGLKFRGSQAWPCFRSTYPGCVPWFLDVDEMRITAHILEQTEVVVMRVKDDPSILGRPDDRWHLIRRLDQSAGRSVWVDEKRDMPLPPALEIPARLTQGMIAGLLRHPQTKDVIEVDLVMMTSTPVHAKNERPYFAYMLLLVDGGSGTILSMDMLSPLPALEQMWGEVIPLIVTRLTEIGFIPGAIKVRRDVMEFLVRNLAEHVPMRVRRVQGLPKLENVVRHLQSYMGNE